VMATQPPAPGDLHQAGALPDGSATTRQAPRSSRLLAGRAGAAVRGLAGLVVLAALMEIIGRAGIVDKQFLPPFSEVVARLFHLLGNSEFLTSLRATIVSFLLGIVIASVIGTVLGVLFGLSQTVYLAMRGVVELIRPVPPVSLIPLVILVFGNGLQMKMVIVVFAAVWPILFNTMYGVQSVEPLQRQMAVSFGKSRLQVIRQVVLPAAAPLIATGIRVSSSISLVVVITVELIAGGTDGLGAFISSARAAGTEVKDVYAGILAAGILGLIVNLVMARAERRWFGWASQSQES
jgi:NitT/TauT family transport system permease protein